MKHIVIAAALAALTLPALAEDSAPAPPPAQSDVDRQNAAMEAAVAGRRAGKADQDRAVQPKLITQPGPDPNTPITLTVGELQSVIAAAVAQAQAQSAQQSAAPALKRLQEQVKAPVNAE